MNGFLLDTNVLSELIKHQPSDKVVAWINSMDEQLLYISVLTLGEIRKGVALLSSSNRKMKIEAWLDKDLRERFEGRVLAITESIAERWGAMAGQAQLKKAVLPVIDGLLAATALQHNLILVTRNTKDVLAAGVSLFNPWEE